MASFDDASINTLLDDLISSARKEVDVKSTDATTSQHDVIFTRDTVHEGIEAVNVLLSTAYIGQLPPLREDDGEEECGKFDSRTVLAAALTTLIRVTRANAANVALRERAEATARDAAVQLESAHASVASVRTRMEAAIDTATAAQRRADASERERDVAIRKYAGEAHELKTRLQVAIGREKVLIQTTQRREKDTALLKQRVHSIINTSRAVPVLQHITSASSSHPLSNRSQPDSRLISKEKAQRAETARLRVSEEENRCFRDLLRAVQEELDDLLVNCDRLAISGLDPSENNEYSERNTGENSHSQSEYNKENDEGDANTVKANEGTENESEDSMTDNAGKKVSQCVSSTALLSNYDVAPAPTEKQMGLPFEMIREEFESSLERKFQILRSILTDAQ